MRRTAGLVLIGMGAFFLAFAPMMRFYVADRAVAAPTDVYARNTLRATDATYFDAGSLEQHKGATLVATSTTRGDVRSSTEDVAVWDMFTSVEDPESGTAVNHTQRRIAFDRYTNMLVGGHGSAVDGDTSVRQRGVGALFPFDTEQRTYRYFDATLRQATPIEFDGAEEVEDLTAYRFVQQVSPTKVGELDVPGELVGQEDEDDLTVSRFTEGTRTIWVEPTTGSTVKQREVRRDTLRTDDGVDRLTVFDADLRMIDSDVNELVEQAKEGRAQITLVRSWVPGSALAAGGILAGIGVLLFTGLLGSRSGARRKEP